MNAELTTGQLVALIIPLAMVQLGLIAFALYDLVKRKQVRGGNKWLWGAIIVLIEYIGPILYFVVGREED